MLKAYVSRVNRFYHCGSAETPASGTDHPTWIFRFAVCHTCTQVRASGEQERGLLIVIEGIDGSGKTTQVRLLTEALQRMGETVVTSKEPTDGPWGRRIRESATTGRMSLDDELAAFINDRKDHVREVIRPALDAGKIVILDRYFYSTMAYQGSRGKDPAELKQTMEALAPIPDVVLLIDIEPELSLARIAESRNEIPNEFETLENLTRVRRVFNSIPDPHIIKIDGSLPASAVHQAILSKLLDGPLKARRSLAEELQRQPSGPSRA